MNGSGTRAWQRRWLLALIASMALVGAGVAPADTTVPAAPVAVAPSGVVTTQAGARPLRITLVTGDIVSYSVAPDGKRSVGLVAGSGPLRLEGVGEHLYAIPADAAQEFFSGTVDRELFDVAYLAENGYADSKAGSLPVIVQYSQGTDPATADRKAEALPASDVTVALPSVHGAGVAVKKGRADAFWSSVTAGSGPALAGGLKNVWLDRKVEVTDDVSNPQIGAPIAWAAGYDGAGVKVAVLDTGIDLTHPDLQNKVVDSQVFTDEASVQDGHGHGTHVASIIAGSGAASGGQYKGVAPGAQLLVGKVLDNSGSGSDSQVIAGMQWAAAQGAKVVSMSLGGDPTNGTDPVSQAVNQITESTGTLFVIAAGNSGPTPSTIDAPGAADDALTVAAVDRDDQVAGFSSRGPRVGDRALKPDIAAPGVHIIAARAANTQLGPPVGDYYTVLSGTSMATPHVAASAAILSQEHPGWHAAQLKAALMSSAKDLGVSPYEQGAGRVDIGQAVSQQVFATTTSLDYGAFPAPQVGPPVTKTITYSNFSAQPVTLTLVTTFRAPDGGRAPAGMLTLAESTLTVPAGGTADAHVTLDPTMGGTGGFSGSVAATAAGVRLTTPVVAFKGEPTKTLTIRGIPRPGQQAGGALGFVTVFGIDHPDVNVFLIAPNPLHLQLPAGTYSIASSSSSGHGVQTDENDTAGEAILQLDPQFELQEDRELVFDNNKTVEARIEPPQPSDWHSVVLGYRRVLPNGQEDLEGTVAWHLFWPQTFRVSPTDPVTLGSLRFDIFTDFGPEPVKMQTGAPSRLTLHPRYDLGYQPYQTIFHGTQTVPLVFAGQASPQDLAGLDLRGKLALVLPNHYASGWQLCLEESQLDALAQAGAIGVVAYNPAFLYMGGACQDRAIPTVGLPQPEGLTLRQMLEQGSVSISIDGREASPSYVYNLDYPERGRIPDNLVYHASAADVAAVDRSVHSGQPTFNWSYPFTLQADEDFSARTNFVLAAPAVTREYFGPVAPDTIWPRLSVNTFQDAYQDMLWSVFPRSDVRIRSQSVGEGPYVPGPAVIPDVLAARPALRLLCDGCREGDSFTGLFATTSGEPSNGGQVVIGDTHLYRDGQEVPNVGDPFFGFFPFFNLPPDTGTYLLTLGYQNNGAGLPELQDVQTSWTFTSPGTSHPGETVPGAICFQQAILNDLSLPCRADPLVFLRYDLNLGLDNRLPAPGANRISISAYHQPTGGPTPAIAGLTLSVSYDGGAHWRPVDTAPKGDGRFDAQLSYPAPGATSGFVSLRVEAWDTAGNRIVQTVVNAFGLKTR